MADPIRHGRFILNCFAIVFRIARGGPATLAFPITLHRGAVSL